MENMTQDRVVDRDVGIIQWRSQDCTLERGTEAERRGKGVGRILSAGCTFFWKKVDNQF